ncbi:acyl-CoA dehydrogenase family protein [Desulfurispora thermophila]|uniref:acyl-CoA dehydrogenase family protein n=1 Tax=Desulfurispora thermophila TaxID=265470 RepID=UPI000381CEF5|nr:acyl-CoA dehydrogenase family protein [Desulfurispora thermophila]
MNFHLSEELRLLRDTVRRLARQKIAPRAAEIDQTGTYPEDIYQAFKQTGLLGLCYPEQYGGAGLGTLGLCLAVEEVAKYCCASGLILLLTRLSTAAIAYGGSEAQKQEYIRGTCEGSRRGCFCLTEPAAGSDAAGIKTRAERSGDHYILNGSKCFISGAPVADFFLVAAKTDPAAGHRGMSVFVVDKGTPGLSIGKIEKKMGVKGVPVSEVVLEDCRVPAQNLVGRENDGFKLVMLTLNSVRPIVAARGLGLAQGALQYAVDYTRERQAFGRPIADFQGLRWMMADMAMEIEAARWLVYHAASIVDEGRAGKEVAPYFSMAKAYASEVAVRTAHNALQLLGGYGYMQDYPLERYYRDARQLMIVEGTSQVHREIISRAIVEGTLHWL